MQGLFGVMWYFISSKTKELGKNELLWKLTSLEWVSTYIAFTYFFLSLLSSFRSTIIKQKLKVSLYLLTMSLLGLSLIVSLVLNVTRNSEEFEEYTIDLATVFTNAMTKGGFLIITLIESKNVGDFDVPSWTILIIFDVYLTGWYCFVQHMCKQATGSYSYQALNYLSIEQLGMTAVAMLGSSLLIKYIMISIIPKPIPKPVPEKRSKKE